MYMILYIAVTILSISVCRDPYGEGDTSYDKLQLISVKASEVGWRIGRTFSWWAYRLGAA